MVGFSVLTPVMCSLRSSLYCVNEFDVGLKHLAFFCGLFY